MGLASGMDMKIGQTGRGATFAWAFFEAENAGSHDAMD